MKGFSELKLKKLVQKIKNGGDISLAEASPLWETEFAPLLFYADKLRKHFKGDKTLSPEDAPKTAGFAPSRLFIKQR
jgi:hypothetical protein